MKITSRFYNEDRLRYSVEEVLLDMTKEEALSWKRHPCTQALNNLVQAELCALLNVWLDGGLSDEGSIDTTVQRVAEARGAAQTLDKLLESIQDIGNSTLNGEIDD